MAVESLSLKIRGIVQGVGFRPFVHKLARQWQLKGRVKNSSSGIELELEGERAALEGFLEALPKQAPVLCLIESMEAQWSESIKGYEDFKIQASLVEQRRATLVSPDIATCPDCLREMRDKKDRRYRYPFINCTNCGPRFTIIKDLPYDRPGTSMGSFPMCPDCRREYEDIEDRRYHAQPDCCPDCGPRLRFLTGSGEEQEGDPLELAKAAIEAGQILCVKGLGGMHLACRADVPEVTAKLRRRKHRDEKPFALMARDIAAAERICHVSEEETALLESRQRPIVLLRKRSKGMEHISENGYIGLMLPYAPLHHLLLEDRDLLVMTSANISDLPIIYKDSEALSQLKGIADAWLLHDREIQTRCDDSLCFCLDGKEYPVRRSRGYVPYPIIVDGLEDQQILACGGEQKAGFALSRGRQVFLSQHIGDLKNLETLECYSQQIEHFKRLFDISPEAVACDMHPDYLSTAYAREQGLPLIQVQHHHAHMAACMADSGLEGPVLALTWDGTGYGADGTSWGGELLAGDYGSFRRLGHILPLALPGGDKAAKDIRRLAVSITYAAGEDSSFIAESDIFRRMLEKDINCPKSSGMGRLFDAAAALIGIKDRAGYEGQGAVLLEAAAREGEGGRLYPYELAGSPLVFDWRPMVTAMVKDREQGRSKADMAAAFMDTLIHMAAESLIAAGRETGLDRVCLSGGSFQNMYIMGRLPRILEKEGFRVYHHSRVAPNDQGLSLGQLMVAQAKLKGK